MNNSRLPDTPWHIGYVKKEESDPRRHKARCVYITHEGKCSSIKSGYRSLKCGGSVHCIYYAENEEQLKEVYLNTRTAEDEEADTFRRTISNIISKNNNGSNPENEIIEKEIPNIFSGVKTIKIKSIRLPVDYSQWHPNYEEEERLIQYYETYKKMDKPIIVKLKNDQYYLKDNYLQYYVSKKLNKKWIRSTMDINPTSSKC